LAITGDGADNSIQISTLEDAVNGTGFRIQGLIKNGATTVNGGSSDDFFNVTSVEMNLNGGDDYLAITNNLAVMLACLNGTSDVLPTSDVVIPGRAILQMGDGSNQVDLGSVTTGLRLLIEGGAQSDVVRLCGADVGTNLMVRTFGEADDVIVRHSSVAEASNIRTANGNSDVAIDGLVSRDLFVLGGNHEDDVSFNGISIEDDVTVQGFFGADKFDIGVADSFPWDLGIADESSIGDKLIVRSGDGVGTIDLRALTANQISVMGGFDFDFIRLQDLSTSASVYVNALAGNSTVHLDNLIINTALWLNLGVGNDLAFVSNTFVGTNASITALGGTDQIEIDNLDVLNNLYAFMGDGKDDLFIDTSSATNAWLFGGAGHDRYFSGTNDFDSENVNQFEENI